MSPCCIVCCTVKVILLIIIAAEIRYMIRISRRTHEIEKRVLDIIQQIFARSNQWNNPGGISLRDISFLRISGRRRRTSNGETKHRTRHKQKHHSKRHRPNHRQIKQHGLMWHGDSRSRNTSSRLIRLTRRWALGQNHQRPYRRYNHANSQRPLFPLPVLGPSPIPAGCPHCPRWRMGQIYWLWKNRAKRKGFTEPSHLC